MKRGMVRGGLVLAVILVLMLGLCTSASAYSGQQIEAAKAPGEVAIDGDLSEWDTSSPMTANTMEQVVRDPGQWTDAGDCSFEVYAMWSDENLYLAAKVLDDTPFMYREGFPPDMADSLVVFFSTDPGADPERAEYAKCDFRFTQIIDDYDFCNGIDRDMIADNAGFETVGEDGDEQVLAGFECAVQELEGGYTFECVIPWSNFSNENLPALKPEAGTSIGFEIGMFDLDFPCPGVATVRMQASGSEEVDANPSLWGTLTFVEK